MSAGWREVGGSVDSTKQRERMFNLPGVIVVLIGILVAVHVARVYLLSDEADDRLLAMFAFVPGRMSFLFDPNGIAEVLAQTSAHDGSQQIAQYLLGDGQAQPWTVLTYAFLHADWTHVGVNSIWLAAFGAPVARRFGKVRFLALFVVAAFAGALAHFLTHMYDLMPVVGASASISGAMGAAVRFVFHPDAPLGSPGGFLNRNDDRAYHLPPIGLLNVWRDSRVVMFIAVWFGVNFVFGLIAGPLHIASGAVAWEAHVGGFLAGLLLFSLFDPPMTRWLPPPDIEEPALSEHL